MTTTFTPNDAFTKKYDENGNWLTADLRTKVQIIDAMKSEMRDMVKQFRAEENPLSTFQINEMLATFRDDLCIENGISHLEFCELRTWAEREGVKF